MEDNKLGAFIVPTGIGASIGGYAGDASFWAREFSKYCKLIVNPNVVNAACFSGITDKMFYVEGYSLDEFFKGKLNLQISSKNSVGVVFDKSIPQDVLNIHINTINAVKTVYGIDVFYEVTKSPIKVDFFVDNSGISTGEVKNVEELEHTSKNLIKKGASSIAIVCLFDDDNQNEDYASGVGVDPVGGVEAIISHYISRELKVPCAHAPAFCDYSISTNIVNPKAAAEYITPTFLPCVLLGLAQAPRLVKNSGFSIQDLDFLVMPFNSLGSVPVFEALKRSIPVFAVKENITVLNVDKFSVQKDAIIEVDTYEECLEHVKKL